MFNTTGFILELTFDRAMTHPGTAPTSEGPSTDGAVGVWSPNGDEVQGTGAQFNIPMEEISVSAGDNVLNYTGDWIEAVDGSLLQPFSGFPLTVT